MITGLEEPGKTTVRGTQVETPLNRKVVDACHAQDLLSIVGL